MSYNKPHDPCRIIDSDSDDEKDRLRPRASLTVRPVTAKSTTRQIPLKTPDWDTTSNPIMMDVSSNTKKKQNPSDENRSTEPKSRVSSSSSSNSSSKMNKSHDSMGPESPQISPAVAQSTDFDPIPLIQEDLYKFVMMTIPKEYSSFVQCSLRRDKDGVQGSFSPTFYLQVERPSDKRKFFLLAARKATKVNRQSEFFITTNVETLSDKADGDGYVGKLRGNNVAGTEYTLYDNGLSPNKPSNTRHLNSREHLRRELAAIVYNTNILGVKGPRQMTAMIPKLEQEIRPARGEQSVLEQWRARRLSYLIQLRNKTPVYNEETKTYVIRFIGSRVAQPSVKNFQIVLETENHEEEVVMQFGRVDDDLFTCDYRYPLTAIQAFGIALSSFDSRLARE